METYELEKRLQYERVEGDVFATCDARVLTYRVSVRDLAIDGPWTANSPMGMSEYGMAGGPGHALRLELEKVMKTIESDCRAAHREAATSECARLDPPLSLTLSPHGREDSSSVAATEERFTAHARALGEWPACFSGWFLARYGLTPPPLPRQSSATK